MKAVSGIDDSTGTSYRPSNKVPYISTDNLYNDKIKDCWLSLQLEDIWTGKIPIDDGTVTGDFPAILFVGEAYPVAIQPINLSIDQPNEFATFDVLFNYVDIKYQPATRVSFPNFGGSAFA
jgi:hypothetical protein